jgi:hypothetical protein
MEEIAHFNVSGLRLKKGINPLNAELNPICHLLALLGAHHFLHVSRIRVKKNLNIDKCIGNLTVLIRNTE